MRWSFSAHSTFQRCQRQWFYRSIFASSRASEPDRLEANRLKNLEGIKAWRGKIVDRVISESVVPAVEKGHTYTAAQALRDATRLFEHERMILSNTATSQGNGERRFFEREYEGDMSEAAFIEAKLEITAALQAFYEADLVWSYLRQGSRLIPQRAITFRHVDTTVQVVPDLIIFRDGLPPILLDWKVNVRALRDYWLQLVTGAIALARCTPHRDWPTRATDYPPEAVELLEVQLLLGEVRILSITDADVADAEDFISVSASQMEIARGNGTASEVPAERFDTARSPWICHVCSFRKLCWRQ